MPPLRLASITSARTWSRVNGDWANAGAAPARVIRTAEVMVKSFMMISKVGFRLVNMPAGRRFASSNGHCGLVVGVRGSGHLLDELVGGLQCLGLDVFPHGDAFSPDELHVGNAEEAEHCPQV